jgi:hypothetical protein
MREERTDLQKKVALNPESLCNRGSLFRIWGIKKVVIYAVMDRDDALR